MCEGVSSVAGRSGKRSLLLIHVCAGRVRVSRKGTPSHTLTMALSACPALPSSSGV